MRFYPNLIFTVLFVALPVTETLAQAKPDKKTPASVPNRLLPAPLPYTLLSANAPAAQAAKPLTQYVLEIWQTEQGLPSNTLFSIRQTRDGYVWIGTLAGLVRFDGAKFSVFTAANTKGLRSNSVQKLVEDRSGTLWIGTGNGISRYRDGQFTHYGTAQGLADNTILALAEGVGNKLWIGTREGLNCIENDSVVPHPAQERLQGQRVSAVAEDSFGSLWVGTPRAGLYRFQDSAETHFTKAEGLPDNAITQLYLDRAGNLWVGMSSGLCRADKGDAGQRGQVRFLPYPTDADAETSVSDLWESASESVTGKSGGLWVGTNRGLYRWQENQFSRFTSTEGLSQNDVRALCEDHEGNLWVGTNRGGLNRLFNGNITTFTTQEGLACDGITAVTQTRDGALWIGGYGGLQRTHNGITRLFTAKDGIPTGFIRAIGEAADGAVWIGTYGDGLYKYQGGNFIAYTSKDGLFSDIVQSICVAADGTTWFGTRSGLNLFENKELSGFPIREVNFLYADDKAHGGDLWICTDGGGIIQFTNGEFIPFTMKDGLSSNVVLCTYRDKQGTLWIGANDGLNAVMSDSIRSFKGRGGLLDQVVFQLFEDELGYIWMGTGSGIYRVKRDLLNAYAEGRLSSIRYDQYLRYEKSDGMKSAVCTPLGLGCKTADGRLWFPTSKGVAVINPLHLRVNTTPPPVLLESFTADSVVYSNLTASAPDRLELNRSDFNRFFFQDTLSLNVQPGAEKFEFHYTALSFIAPAKMKFKYRLTGLDKDWVDAGTRRTAYYTNLPPGAYTFVVAASNNDGVWNEVGASMAFYVQPFFYQTTWFTALCLVAAAGAGAGIYLVRVRQLKLQSRKLEKLVGERTEDLQQKASELEESYHNVTVLSQIGKQITTTLDLDRILKTIYNSVNSLMNADVFAIDVYDEATHTLACYLAVENERVLSPYRISMNETGRLSVWCASNRQEIFMNDVAAEHTRYIKARGTPTGSRPAQSLMYLPLVFEDRLVGVLGVQSFQKQAYTPYHLDILRTLASYAAAALDNARSFQEAERLRLIAEDASRVKTELLSIAAHDLKNPLQSIMGFAELIRERANDVVDSGMSTPAVISTGVSAVTEMSDIIGKASQRMLYLVQDLLMTAAVDTGNLRLSLEPSDLAELLRTVIQFNRPAAARKHQTLTLDSTEPCIAHVDSRRIREAFENLVSNAIKYSPEGKPIAVSCKFIAGNQVSPTANGLPLPAIRISVRDEGLGLSVQDMEKLFGRFVRLSARPTGGESSTGLGLSIVKDLVELHGGKVWAESEGKGKGSTFYVELPAASVPETVL